MEAIEIIPSKILKRFKKFAKFLKAKIKKESININLDVLLAKYEEFQQSEEYLLINQESYDPKKHSFQDIMRLSEIELEDETEERDWIDENLQRKYFPTFNLCPIINIGDLYMPIIANDAFSKDEIKILHQQGIILFLIFHHDAIKNGEFEEEIRIIKNKMEEFGVDYSIKFIQLFNSPCSENNKIEPNESLKCEQYFLDLKTAQGIFFAHINNLVFYGHPGCMIINKSGQLISKIMDIKEDSNWLENLSEFLNIYQKKEEDLKYFVKFVGLKRHASHLHDNASESNILVFELKGEEVRLLFSINKNKN